ncbi:MAG: lamin tail domain-containing protein, partial [Verrucomicrobiota bacterium]
MNYTAQRLLGKDGSRMLAVWAGLFLIFAAAAKGWAVPASISSISPPPNSVLTNVSSITVAFSGEVTGVAADDIFLNGTSATNVSGSGATYTYIFPRVAEGILQAVWNPTHLIRFASSGARLDELDASTTWNYTRIDAEPPTILTVSPLPGSTVGQLSQIFVTFSELVSGVDASDLQVNGRSAKSVSGAGAGPYVFEIDAPASGTVQVYWLANHGIHDLAANANLFSGTPWNYSFHPGEFAGNIVINEFLASNLSTNGLRDEDGELQDWIELFNRGILAINLQGWSLTQDENLDSEWIFPAVTIEPGQFLVVFASSKNRKPTDGAPLHTNFRLSSAGQYLALLNANQPREVATSFQPGYPPQRPDISYGLVGGAFGYLTNSTPGSVNFGAASFAGIAEKPQASVKSGFFSLPLSVTLNSATAQTMIRYTRDGSEPTASSGILYTGPIPIAPSASSPVVNLRAIAYHPGLLCSQVSTFSYIFPSAVLQQSATPAGFPSTWVTSDGATVVPADYEMDPQVLTNGIYAAQALQALTNLPALSIVLGNDALFSQQNGIYANPNPVPSQRAAWERPASAELIMPDGRAGFRLNAGLRAQGGTSRDPNRTRKHSLRLFFNQEYDGKLDFPVFEDSSRRKFNTLVVDAGSNITWHNRLDSLAYRAQYIRDQFVSDLQLAAGSPATHGRFVNLFLNGLFWGVCYLH